MASVVILLTFTVVTGLIYPFVGLTLGQALFSHQANGSLMKLNGKIVGSTLLAQRFTSPIWFTPRPSAVGYQGLASGASNLALSNPVLAKQVASLAAQYRRENHLGTNAVVPADAVMSSASGLDPDISVANALDQAPRVASLRHLKLSVLTNLIAKATQSPPSWLIATPVVNVVELNLSLAKLQPKA